MLAKLRRVSFPTIGHYLEDGFVDPAIRSLLADVRVVGRAMTARIADADAVAMNHALSALTPGDVLVVDMGGDAVHASVGAVTSCAALSAGAVGIVVDGVVTDIVELRQGGLPVFARGTSILTTKRHDGDNSAINVPVMVGGVSVNPGDIVLADDNGVLVLTPDGAADVVDLALASDAAEPETLDRLRAGEPLADVLHMGGKARRS
ncbi:dimethylmenaquinone methyltransferase [Rhodococcus opacus]|uniref:Putative 4-hydroxy-4-methyl-2-oxoglutarate aldolase n=1 Tax=Rhodococcus opacus TaxID=37919 RepID=A0A076EX84_RHOOP|nr:dimethylmenaquinone methyltransferase [Rhodococcus opacus]